MIFNVFSKFMVPVPGDAAAKELVKTTCETQISFPSDFLIVPPHEL